MSATLHTHPGLNPEYFAQMEQRRECIAFNKAQKYALVKRRPVTVPKQPNKYVPHIGAKQRAKGAAV